MVCLCSKIGWSQNDGWHISTTATPQYTGIVLANGRLGILPSKAPFQTQHIILNNVYDKASSNSVSRVLRGMNFGNLAVEIDGEKLASHNISHWKQTLHMKEARLITTFDFKNKATITYSTYALRNVPYAGYIDVAIQAHRSIQVKVTGNIDTPKEYQQPSNTFRVFDDLETSVPILQTVAKSKFGKHLVSTSATFIWHQIQSTNKNQRPALKHYKSTDYSNQLSFEESIKPGKSLDFAWTAAQCSTQDFADPRSESERFVIFNLLTPKIDLLGQHRALWQTLWQGDIIIEGDLSTQQDIRLALYHLYAFGKAGTDLSIAPMGLSSQGYNGHIFWDAELWMFPPLLVFNQGIAKSMVNYRAKRLAAAQRKATNFGYKGAMFPWESDDTGEEATPTWALTGTFEHHITADIGIAFWNYYRVTKDKKWLADTGYPMLKAIADYWVSRVTKNAVGSYSIKNVIGANEYAHNVTDNAFTNGVTITVLHYASLAAKILQLSANPHWKAVAQGIAIHRMKDGTTKEHLNYQGQMIKQADVNLLTYPLNIVTDKAHILKDLKYYESKLDPKGPAMGKSIFAVIYARLGDAKNAFRLFKDSYQPNKRPPFGALAESATSNNPYFATGAGGMLQVILFGFGGLHFTQEGIIQKKPILPAQWKSLTITGVGPDKKTYVVK